MKIILALLIVLLLSVVTYAQTPPPTPLTKQQIEQRIQEIALEERYIQLQIEKRGLIEQYQALEKKDKDAKPQPDKPKK